MVSGALVGQAARMEQPTPFCDTCGRVGVSLTGMHPSDDGLVRWALYRCGHVRTIVLVSDVEPERTPSVFAEHDDGRRIWA
jgi:hypothetical protein